MAGSPEGATGHLVGVWTICVRNQAIEGVTLLINGTWGTETKRIMVGLPYRRPANFRSPQQAGVYLGRLGGCGRKILARLCLLVELRS